jgi:hypothetical protein
LVTKPVDFILDSASTLNASGTATSILFDISFTSIFFEKILGQELGEL